MALVLWRSTTPAVAVMLVLLPDPLTQCAAVSTMVGEYSAPPQPMESRTMKGNSPWAARVPPTTGGASGAAAWVLGATGAGAAEAEDGWRLMAASTTAPAAAVLLRTPRMLNGLPFVGGHEGFAHGPGSGQRALRSAGMSPTRKRDPDYAEGISHATRTCFRPPDRASCRPLSSDRTCRPPVRQAVHRSDAPSAERTRPPGVPLRRPGCPRTVEASGPGPSRAGEYRTRSRGTQGVRT